MQKRLTFLALTCMFILSCSISSLREIGNVKNVSTDDVEMNAAIKRAQDTLPLFIRAFQSPTPTQKKFLIKAEFPYGGANDAEYIWLNNLSYEGNQFEGNVGNEPIYVLNIKLGDRVTVSTSRISDWMIIDDNRLLGGFTIHVLRNRMTDAERKQFDADFGFIIPDEPALP